MSRRNANTTKVFVGSLPTTVTADDLKTLFAPYGQIVECDIANRCGFLHLEDKDLAAKAIEELNNTSFMGGNISVEIGRVKPPRRNRETNGRGGRDRGGPYARNDGYARGPPRNPPMGGAYGREYSGYGDRYGEFDRGMPMRSYGTEYDHIGERRPIYDDRRGYMDDRRGYAPLNGYDRRPYDDRSGYDDRGVYDDRRLPPPLPPHNAYDDRRSSMGNNRQLMPPGGATRGPPMGGYERGPSGTDMYSRRSDYGQKTSLPPPADVYGTCDPSLGYNNTAVTGGYAPVDTGYGAATVGYTSVDETYGANAGYAAGAYDTRNQSGGYATVSGGYGTSAYGTAAGGYTTGYGNGDPAYNMAGGYTDSYDATRTDATYDAAYALPPQPRSFASGTGGPGPRGDMPPGAGHRY